MKRERFSQRALALRCFPQLLKGRNEVWHGASLAWAVRSHSVIQVDLSSPIGGFVTQVPLDFLIRVVIIRHGSDGDVLELLRCVDRRLLGRRFVADHTDLGCLRELHSRRH